MSRFVRGAGLVIIAVALAGCGSSRPAGPSGAAGWYSRVREQSLALADLVRLPAAVRDRGLRERGVSAFTTATGRWSRRRELRRLADYPFRSCLRTPPVSSASPVSLFAHQYDDISYLLWWIRVSWLIWWP